MKKGTVTVTAGTTVWCRNTGRLTCTDPVSDFTPPQADSVVLRLDGADAQETTQRSRGDSVPRVGMRGIRWTPKISRDPSPGVVFQSSTSTSSSLITFGSKNGRRTVAFRSESTGMEGTWGPFSSPAFTIVAVLRTLEPITTAVPLLRSGSMTINLPMNTTTPQPTLENRTWSDALLFQWRRLVIQNSVVGNTQYWMVDGNLVTTEPLFVQQFSTITAVTIGGTGPLEIAELIVWDEVLPTSTLIAIENNLTAKWNTANNYPPPQPLPTALPMVDGGYTLPVPNALWLDSSKASSVLTDSGIVANHLQQKVAMWQDQSGNNHHATFASPYALLGFSPAVAINGRPLVRIRAAPGMMPPGVLSSIGSGPFVIVAVWVPSFVGGGGHPFNVNGQGRFSEEVWTEGVASDFMRTFPDPGAELQITDFTPLVSIWERTGSTITVRLNNVKTDPASGGWVWSASNQADSAWIAHSLTIGGSSRSLDVGEVMVWEGATAEDVQSEMGRDALRVHLFQKWGLLQSGTVAPQVQVTGALPMSIPVLPSALDVWDASLPGVLLDASNQPSVVTGTVISRVLNGMVSNLHGSLSKDPAANSSYTISNTNGRLAFRSTQYTGVSTACISSLSSSILGKLCTMVLLRRADNPLTRDGSQIMGISNGTTANNVWEFGGYNGVLWHRFYSASAWRPNAASHNIWFNVNGTTGLAIPPKNVAFVIQFQYYMQGNDLYVWTSLPSLGETQAEFVVTLTNSSLPVAPTRQLRGGSWFGDIHEIRIDDVAFGSPSTGAIAEHLINKWTIPRFTGYTSTVEGIVLQEYAPALAFVVQNSNSYATVSNGSVTAWSSSDGAAAFTSSYRSTPSPVQAQLHSTLRSDFGGVLGIKSPRDHVFRSTSAQLLAPFKGKTLFLVFRVNSLGNANDLHLIINRVGSESQNDGWTLILSTANRLRYTHYTQAASPILTNVNILNNGFELRKTYVLGLTWPETGNCTTYFSTTAGSTPSVVTAVHAAMNQTKTLLQLGGRSILGTEVHCEMDFHGVYFWEASLSEASMTMISQTLSARYCID